MKKFKQFMYAAFLLCTGMATIVSCGDDDDDPVISYAVSTEQVNLSSEKGASTSFTITFAGAQGQWTISQVPDFVTVSPRSGMGTTTVRVTANDNNSGQSKEGIIKIDVTGQQSTMVRVVQRNLSCYVEPSNILRMSDGLAFNWTFSPSVKYFYWATYEQSTYNKMSESEILSDIVTGDMDDRNEPDNTDFACNYDLTPNTKYVVITIAYAENDQRGSIVATPLTTTSATNQPEAEISDVAYYTSSSNSNYYYGWNIKKNTYCSQYYTYAAASPEDFWAHYMIENNGKLLVAWALKNEIKKDGTDHSTSINNGYSWLPFDNGRDKMYAPKVEGGVTSDFRAFRNTDKYLMILTWGTNSSGEYSGVLNAVWYNNLDGSDTNARNAVMLNAGNSSKNTGVIKKMKANIKDFNFTRLN